VQTDGLSFTTPGAWNLVTPDYPCAWPGQFADAKPQVTRIRPDIAIPPCPLVMLGAGGLQRYGVELYTSAASTGEALLHPIMVLHHGETTVRVFDQPQEPARVAVAVQRAGSPVVHSLQLGLGDDGRVAGGILASLTATR
jgi:hypothetical protein